jgi:DNA repair protein RadC
MPLDLDATPQESAWRGREVADPRDLGPELIEVFGPYPLEVAFVIPLDEANRIIEITLVTVGSAQCLDFKSRDIWERAISLGASSIVMIHTHPLGSVLPSPSDLAATERHVDVGRKIGLPLVDHLIVGPESWRSLRETTDLFDGPRASPKNR